MGLKIAEAFYDRCFITVLATGLPATLLADVTCTITDEAGNPGAGVVTEIGNGWYSCPFTPDAVGTWTTTWSKTLLPANYVFHYPYKEFLCGAGQEGDIQTDVAAVHTHIQDIHDTDLPAVYTRVGAPAGASVSADIAAIKAETASLVTKVDAVDDYVDTEVAAIKAKTDLIPAAPATEAKQDTIIGYIDTEVAAILAAVDTEVAAIKAKTDNLPADPADDSDLDTAIAAVKAETALIVADTNELQTDLHDGGRLDLLVDAIKAKTDNLPADPADESNTQGDLDAILADSNELQTDWVNGGRLDLLIDAVKARTDNNETVKCFFSPCQALVTADTTHTDAALPTVTLPNIAGTITHVYAGFKFRMIENTNAAANKLSGAQEIQINKAGGAWTDAINFVDDQFGVAASTREGGDCIIGYIDVAATINVFNTTAQFQWDEPLTDQDSLKFNDVQTFIIVSYY